MWDARVGRFVTTFKDRDGSVRNSTVQAVQTLWPLLLRSLRAEQRAALVADASDPGKFWSEFPFPSVSRDAPEYTAK
jgi:hypothetical protein